MLRSPRVKLAAALCATLFVVDACSSSSKPSATTSTTSTTVSTANQAPYAQPGPYAVGFTTMHLADGRRVVVWYPATKGSTRGHQQQSIDVGGFLNPGLQAKIPAADRVKYLAAAYQDAPPATQPGKYPIVIFSHGFAGFPEQSVTLTTHLASWGFVVSAPDHVERSLDGLLGTAGQGVPKSTDVAVLQKTLDATVAASNAPGVLHGMVDPDQVVAADHSAGAASAYAFASADARVKAWISY